MEAYRIEHRAELAERERLWRARNPEKAKENQAAWTSSWRARNPEKYDAQQKLQAAVRHGRITRQPCEACGQEPAHGHHEDYSKPLDVVWLCAAHHRERHKAGL